MIEIGGPAELLQRLLTLPEAASRFGLQTGTLRNWISSGKLRGPQGLVYVGRQPRIDWDLFCAAFVKRAD